MSSKPIIAYKVVSVWPQYKEKWRSAWCAPYYGAWHDSVKTYAIGRTSRKSPDKGPMAAFATFKDAFYWVTDILWERVELGIIKHRRFAILEAEVKPATPTDRLYNSFLGYSSILSAGTILCTRLRPIKEIKTYEL